LIRAGQGSVRRLQKMDSRELAIKTLREEAAPTLSGLMQVMADPTAKARERLKAARQFKKCLHSLKRVIEAKPTAPALRQELIEVLRAVTTASLPHRQS
jgi:hypothetical protein